MAAHPPEASPPPPASDHVFDFVVVGGGMIGAAAARHLTCLHGTAASLVVLAPPEPSPRAAATYAGPWGSHYDAARITRQADASAVWADLAMASIARYAELEQRSGLRFFERRGCVYLGPTPRTPMDFLARVQAVARERGIALASHAAAALPPPLNRLFRLPPDYTLLDEGTEAAGIIAPRLMVAAQLKMAAAQGAIILPEAAAKIMPATLGQPCHVLTTTTGGHLRARHVIVAAGTVALVGSRLRN